MKISTISTFFYLAIAGTIVSVISLSLPWLGFDHDLLSSSGQISSGLAAAFGLAVASIALKSYVWSESTERQEIDSIWRTIRLIQNEIYYTRLITTATNGNLIKAETEDRVNEITSLFKTEAVKSLHFAFRTSLTPEFLMWVESGCGGEEMKMNFLKIRLGLLLSENNNWNPNDLINVPLVKIYDYITPIDRNFVRKTYRIR